MRIIDCDNLVKKLNLPPISIALGNFDGFHLGHLELLQHTLNAERTGKFASSVLLFKNHTKEALRDDQHEYIMSLEDKLDLLEEYGISYVFLRTFDREFYSMDKSKFIENMLVETLNAHHIVVGNDYRFGSKASGTVEDLLINQEKYHYKVDIVNDILYHSERISSSKIRKLIKEGKIEDASGMLNRFYTIKGTVISGEKRGRQLGFRTANLKLSFHYVIPKNGVYFTRVRIDNDNNYFYGLTDVGINPTFRTEGKTKIETYIFDFDKNIYDKTLKIEFLEFIRDDIKFDNMEALIHQMQQDEKNMREKINQYKII